MNTYLNTFLFERKTPVEIDQLIASRIRAVRKRRKISQKRLSEKSGVSLGSVKRFEQSGEISFLSLTKLVYALDMEEELIHLFEDVKPLSIEEILNEQH
jgi:transcriptional regulator with XRE-family HTH domain